MRTSTTRSPTTRSPRSFLNRRPQNAAAVHRTPASTGSPSTRLSAAPPPALTPPSAPSRPRATHPPLLLAQNPSEQPRRRRPTPNCRPSRRHPLSRPPRLRFRAPEGAHRRPLAFLLSIPRRRRSPSPDSAGQPLSSPLTQPKDPITLSQIFPRSFL